MRALRIWLLRHRRQLLVDELEGLRDPEKGTIAYARKKLDMAERTAIDRETRIGAIDRELASLERPQTIINRALEKA